MELKNIGGNADLLRKDEKDYNLNYGNKKSGTNGTVELLFTDDDLLSARTAVSCGSCTKAVAQKKDQGSYLIKITYDTSLLGIINKRVYIYYKTKTDGKQNRIEIKLRGKIVK